MTVKFTENIFRNTQPVITFCANPNNIYEFIMTELSWELKKLI